MTKCSSEISAKKKRKIVLVTSRSPLQVSGVNGLVADGTLGPALVTERQVVQHARPAEDVSTARDAGGHRRVETDRAGRHLVAVDALETNASGRSRMRTAGWCRFVFACVSL